MASPQSFLRAGLLGLAFAAVAIPGVCAQGSYDRLIDLHKEFLKFREAPLLDGVEDYRPATISQRQQDLKGLMQRLGQIPRDGWSVPQQVDYLLVKAQMNDLDFNFRVVRPWSRDPGFYVDKFERIPYIETPLESSALTELRGNLKKVPKIVAQARENLTEAVADMGRLAIFHLSQYDGVGQGIPYRVPPPEGTIGWYADLVQRLQQHHPEAAADAQAALAATREYKQWLEGRLGQMNPVGGVGLEDYQWYVTNVRYMPFTVHDLRILADRELHRIQAFLAIERNRNRGLPELRVASNKADFDRSILEAEKQIREHIRKYNLLTIPEGTPDHFESDVFWVVRPGNHLHFWEQLQYRNPLNNHIHASIPGHLFDGTIQARQTNPIRKSNRDGSRAEGWGFYVEEMFLQSGLLDDKPRVKELFYIAALKRAVRIPAELGIQSGTMNLQQASDYMIERVPFLEENLARYDLEVYIRRPTYGMNYTMGRIQIEQLLGERMLQLGDDFKLGEFHDALLKGGMIPIALLRWELTGNDDEVRQFLED